MFTRKALNTHVENFLKELAESGWKPDEAYLFGSYVNGNPKENSDIDLAIWHKKFCGVGFIDFEPFIRIVSKYHPIELHTFNTLETDNYFGEEIKKMGIKLNISQ
ncbi:MAG: nucleotidyltransferase domain-containing protein [Bacteroidota bacterium]|nr:nucleotidyltransferase domain-containing protein [Bacteroidota bacterium]